MCNTSFGQDEAYQAQLAVSSAILEHYNDSGDWLTDDARYALAHMGVGAIPILRSVMRYDGTDMYVRAIAAQALVIIAGNHQEAKIRIIASIMDAAQKESDIEVRTLLVGALIDLQDPDVRRYMRNSLKTGFIRSTYVSMDEVDNVYEYRQFSGRGARDPLYIFGPYFKNAYPYFSRFEWTLCVIVSMAYVHVPLFPWGRLMPTL